MQILILLISSIFLFSCTQSVVGSAALTTGKVVAQERTAGQALDDVTTFWHIKHLYLQENANDLLAGVSVEVIEGRVYLTGNVDTPEARVDAVRLAWQPSKVKEVINEININSEKTLKEVVQSRVIGTQVRGKLIAAKGVRSLNYSVEVVDSVVYLMGIAQSAEELDIATNAASTVKGVRKVVSHVRIKDDPARNV